MKLFHLSHTDLDGYGCQFITNEIYKNINHYNANYGKEIDERLKQIIEDVENDDFKENTILITDLNLSLKQCEFLVNRANESQKKIDLLLLDHHKTGQDCADIYNWYYLDTKRCATKITYDYFVRLYPHIKHLEKFSDVVNAVDIWLYDHKYFELGKVCMKLVGSAKELNRILFPKENSTYIFSLLKNAIELFEEKNPHIKLDDNVHFLKKKFFIREKDDTIDNLISNFVVSILTKNRDKMTIEYNSHKGILTYSIGNTSIIGNHFLLENSDYDFFMDISKRKTISLRSNNKIDVSEMAKELFGGGGHANASGGIFNNFKDGFVYDNIKSQIENKIREVEHV